jgi:membrane fusion protein, heavy metal efflux system
VRQTTPLTRSTKTFLALPLILLLIALSSNVEAHSGNGSSQDIKPDTNKGRVSVSQISYRLADGSVYLSKETQRRLSIRTQIPPLEHQATSIELAGRVIADPSATARIQTTYGGRIERADRDIPLVGQIVKRGETLAFLRFEAEPYTLASQKGQLAELQTQRLIAEQRYNRLVSLEGTVPKKDIDGAKLEAEGLRARELNIQRTLNIREPILAPIDGVIAKVDLVQGQVVNPQQVLGEVINSSRLLVEVLAPKPLVGLGVASAATKESPPLQLKFIGSSPVMREGLVPSLFSIVSLSQHERSSLSVGQPTTVLIKTQQYLKGFVLPANAVVRSPSNEAIVWTKESAERFVSKPVNYTLLDAHRVLVTNGLDEESRVVVDGAPLISQIR